MNDLTMPATGKGLTEYLLVPDVRCAGCCLSIERELSQLADVSNVVVNYAEKRLSYTATSEAASNLVQAQLKKMGYPPHSGGDQQAIALHAEQVRSLLARLGVAGVGMMQVMMFALTSYLAGEQGIDADFATLMRWGAFVVAVPVTFYSALPFHLGAIRDIKNATVGMDVPVSIAILSAFFLSGLHTLSGSGEVYFDSACMFTFFLLTGRYLEIRARQAFHVEQLLGAHLLPGFAMLADGGTVAIAVLKDNDLVKIEQGATVPADCIVVSGETTLDESAFTGESEPKYRSVGERLLAGSTNLEMSVVGRVTGSQPDWVITHLSELYQNAANHKPAFGALADRVAKFFVVGVLLLAFSAGAYWWLAGADNYFSIALSVLVVSCPCALSLATPAAYTFAIGAVKKMGIVISDGAFLEKLAALTTVVFDKTGTLTEGKLELEKTVLLDNSLDEQQAINIAASLELTNLHPVGLALREKANVIFETSEVLVVPGHGVSGSIDGHRYKLGRPEFTSKHLLPPLVPSGNWVLLARDNKACAWFCLSDRYRENAAATLGVLRDKGIRVEVFTGDSSKLGENDLHKIGVEQPGMGMFPEDKIDGVQRLIKAQQSVMMVGDGLNDAGAMAAAQISLAVNPVDSLVQSAADATLVNADLATIPRILEYAKFTRRVIRQNLVWALAYNITVIPLAVIGVLPPWCAALGMSLSSLLVTLNACRLTRLS